MKKSGTMHPKSLFSSTYSSVCDTPISGHDDGTSLRFFEIAWRISLSTVGEVVNRSRTMHLKRVFSSTCSSVCDPQSQATAMEHHYDSSKLLGGNRYRPLTARGGVKGGVLNNALKKSLFSTRLFVYVRITILRNCLMDTVISRRRGGEQVRNDAPKRSLFSTRLFVYVRWNIMTIVRDYLVDIVINHWQGGLLGGEV